MRKFKIRLLEPVRSARASNVVVRRVFRGYMKDINDHVWLFNSRDAAKALAAKARTVGLFYRVVDASESRPGKRKKKKARSVWTVQGGGIETNRRRH